MEFSKLWLGGAGVLVGAISGAYINAQRAAAAANKAAQAMGGEDALIDAARSVGTNSLAAALNGAMTGAIIGAVLVAVYFYFTNPDREMKVRKYQTGDDF